MRVEEMKLLLNEHYCDMCSVVYVVYVCGRGGCFLCVDQPPLSDPMLSDTGSPPGRSPKIEVHTPKMDM